MALISFGGRQAKKLREQNEMLQKQMSDYEREVTENNQLYRALYEYISQDFPLKRDSSLKDYVKKGFEGNPDTFGILLKLSTKFAGVKWKITETQRNGKKVEKDIPELAGLIRKPNYYQNGFEFRQSWILFKYVTGNSIVYSPHLDVGVNKGKLDKDGMLLMPTQNVQIKAGTSFREPVKYYEIDINQRYDIDTMNIWHERFPSLQMQDGQHFMGLSPLKTAINIINAQNKGYEVASTMYANQHPPGVLYKEVADGQITDNTKQMEDSFRNTYKNKYQKEFTIPIFSYGKVGYTKIGYENVRDLQVIDMAEHGVRILCRVFGVPPQVFGDTSSSTYNNMTEAQKAMWEDRLIPDIGQYWDGFNENIARYYGERIKVVADYSDIAALQEDKGKKVVWISQAYNDGVINGDKYLELIGEEPTGLPEMQVRYISANKIPVELANQIDQQVTSNDEQKFYDDNNLKNKL